MRLCIKRHKNGELTDDSTNWPVLQNCPPSVV